MRRNKKTLKPPKRSKAELIRKVLTKTADETELNELWEWLDEDSFNRGEFEYLKLLHELSVPGDAQWVETSDAFPVGLREIKAHIKRRQKKRRLIRFFLIAVAMAVLATTLILRRHSPYSPMSLTFTDAPLKTVINEIEERFDVRIEVGREEILACSFTGTFSGNLTTEDVLRSLAEALHLDYLERGPGHYRLDGNGCPP